MDNKKAIFQKAIELMNDKTDFVFVTIIESSGSSPRGAGSRMLVLPDGSTIGTIGGGNVEFTAGKHAHMMLEKKTSSLEYFKLHPSQAADIGMICGGDVTVYYQYIAHDNTNFCNLCSVILNEWDNNRNSWLILDITDEAAWNCGFYGSANHLQNIEIENPLPLLGTKPLFVTLNGRKYYSEPIQCAGLVYIFGGGHVAQSLVPVLSRLDFQCVVFDDRADFSNKDVFPDAVSCIVGDFEHLSDTVAIEPDDYVCVMSRGHQYDYLIQKQLLETPAYYMGVIGSRKKSAAIREKLLNDGFTEEQISQFKTPIGLAIKAETPAEIAISIAGELIAFRANRQ